MALLEIIEDRYEKGAIILIYQLSVNQWYEVKIGEKTVADALINRLVHNVMHIGLN